MDVGGRSVRRICMQDMDVEEIRGGAGDLYRPRSLD